MIRVQFTSSLMPNIDLHCHSNVSDGLLSPAALVARAAANGVDVLALTDHDDVAGLDEAREAAAKLGMVFINGVEISVTWKKRVLHVVGLNIDPSQPDLRSGLHGIREGRAERARHIAAQLDAEGIPGSLEGAYAFAENKQLIGRSHFARFLVAQGYVKDVKTVFKKYLVKGKPGYVSHQWAELGEAVGWIKASGGTAVLAHPGRYDLGDGNMRVLLAEFKEIGGEAIEVVTASHTAQQYALFARHAAEFGLLASRGSDFHGPGESFFEPGRLPDLPSTCIPVWHDWPQVAL
jgi:predicted metal-dependent phosphoesterase TrpH